MEDLIKALQILAKYCPNMQYPTDCEHDKFSVWVDPAIVSEEDLDLLEKLDFIASEDGGYFYSYRFGSC